MVDFKIATERLKLQRVLDDQEHYAQKCKACSLHKIRRSVAYGTGNPLATFAFVGESPNEDEDRAGKLLLGRSGYFILRMAETFGFTKKDFYYLNVVKCRSAELKVFESGKTSGKILNCPPKDDQIKACSSAFTSSQIRALPNLKMLIALGSTAAHALLEYDLGKISMRNIRKRIFQLQRGPMVAITYHPNYLIRNPLEKPKVYSDLKFAFDVLQGRIEVDTHSRHEADQGVSEYNKKLDTRPWRKLLPHQEADKYSEALTIL